jgi:hypothetical protein
MIGPLPGDGRPEETSRNRILSSADLDLDLIATVEELTASDFLAPSIRTALPAEFTAGEAHARAIVVDDLACLSRLKQRSRKGLMRLPLFVGGELCAQPL